MLSYRILYLKGETKQKSYLLSSTYGLGLSEREVDLHSQIHWPKLKQFPITNSYNSIACS